MALVNIDFYSYYLGMDSRISVLYPEKRGIQPCAAERNHPVLYLLHGHSDDESAWVRKGGVEEIASRYDLIVVMPSVHRSFYTNCRHGHFYEDYIVKELPILIKNMFHASSKREDTFIAGLSMGGYGALKLSLKYPEIYKGVVSMSAALDAYSSLESGRGMFTVPDFESNIDNVFGGIDGFYGSENDVFYLAEEYALKKDEFPLDMYICCGKADPLYDQYLKLKEKFSSLFLDAFFDGERDYGHEWPFWRLELALALKRLQLPIL